MSGALRAFGDRRAGLDYRPRAAVYGMVLRDGYIALVQQGYSHFKYDFPGGAIEAGETNAEALKREFLEEAGVEIEPGAAAGEVLQYFVNAEGDAFANHAHFYEALIVGEKPEAKVEADHELVWMRPLEALKRLEKDGYAWALLTWLRGLAA
ncbi:NUDIX domain-containing protein [Asticcacaulis sp. YBE204]|uniref:NUDIX domain-containing protein n=1 Tax=Asticcacaulis sp. YBE204 TaxID=1282363 RepID=UPI0003C3B057|nr:NUDIX domain-containing protein [Asticcacaulis sp. YBE204]ESQ77343.1 hypothetical protein AEYBE204_17605 [Asticcacaulis sp. YBE204]